MLRRVLDAYGGQLPADVHVLFANTGKERPETLDFVRDCAVNWGVNIVWLERDGGAPEGARFREVEYEIGQATEEIKRLDAMVARWAPLPLRTFEEFEAPKRDAKAAAKAKREQDYQAKTEAKIASYRKRLAVAVKNRTTSTIADIFESAPRQLGDRGLQVHRYPLTLRGPFFRQGGFDGRQLFEPVDPLGLVEQLAHFVLPSRRRSDPIDQARRRTPRSARRRRTPPACRRGRASRRRGRSGARGPVRPREPSGRGARCRRRGSRRLARDRSHRRCGVTVAA